MLMNSKINPKRHRFGLLKLLKLSILVMAVIPSPIFAQSVFLEDDQSGYGISFSVSDVDRGGSYGLGISSKRSFDVGLSVFPSSKEDAVWGYSFDMAWYILKHKQNAQPLLIAAFVAYGYTEHINTALGGMSYSSYLGLGGCVSIVPAFSFAYSYSMTEFSRGHSQSIAVEFDLPICFKIVENLKVVLSPGIAYADKQTAKGISIGVLVVDN